MSDRQRLVDQLVLHEGLRLRVYRDSMGIETIGVGRNLRDKGLSSAEAFLLLDHDIDEVLHDLATVPWFTQLDPVRQRVLADMRFNLGPGRFRRFVRMLRAIEARDFASAGSHMLDSLWARQVQTRAGRLAAMMATGEDYAR